MMGRAGTGFFSAAVVKQRQPEYVMPRCGECGLKPKCHSQDLKPRGQRGSVVFVGDAPSVYDDMQGGYSIPTQVQVALNCTDGEFVGRFGYTTALTCHTDVSKILPKQVDCCRPNLKQALSEAAVVVPMGFNATRAVLGPAYRESTGAQAKWVGWRIPLQRGNYWVCPTYGLSDFTTKAKDREFAALKVLFNRHVRAAVELTDRPYDVVPDYSKQVEAILSPDKAAAAIRDLVKAGRAVAFDYETNCLKPDRDDAEIITVGLSNGERTVACLVQGPVKDAMREFLVSPIPKIGANCKFEDRWGRAKLGVPTNNIVWDCMLSAHHLDNRAEITSVKFQAFVRLGLTPWDYKVGSYFQADGATKLNRIKDCDIHVLLNYNGVDALVEFLVARHQKKEMLDAQKIR
jgi:uracil-DNA glycosylase